MLCKAQGDLDGNNVIGVFASQAQENLAGTTTTTTINVFASESKGGLDSILAIDISLSNDFLDVLKISFRHMFS